MWRIRTFFILAVALFACQSVNEKEVEVDTAPSVEHIVYSKRQMRKIIELDDFFQKRYQKKKFNGCVLYADSGRVLYKEAFGYRDFKKKDTLEIDHAFQLASVSKPITAIGILKLYQNNKLSLDDTVQKFIPDFPYADITVRLLLAQRSGLPNYMYFGDKHWPDWDVPISNDDVLELMVRYEPKPYYRPNRRYNYSNTNYAILASIIERVSGTTYSKYMSENIFRPLNMSRSFVYNKCKMSKNDIPRRAIGYDERGRVAEDTYLNGVVGDKGIYSTVEDLYSLDKAITLGGFLPDSLLKIAYLPFHRDLRKNDNYGLGWRLDNSDEKNPIIYHTGWWKGFRSYYIRMPQSKKVLIILSNTARRGTFLKLKHLVKLMQDES